jgi:hypothetical protein
MDFSIDYYRGDINENGFPLLGVLPLHASLLFTTKSDDEKQFYFPFYGFCNFEYAAFYSTEDGLKYAKPNVMAGLGIDIYKKDEVVKQVTDTIYVRNNPAFNFGFKCGYMYRPTFAESKMEIIEIMNKSRHYLFLQVLIEISYMKCSCQYLDLNCKQCKGIYRFKND